MEIVCINHSQSVGLKRTYTSRVSRLRRKCETKFPIKESIDKDGELVLSNKMQSYK